MRVLKNKQNTYLKTNKTLFICRRCEYNTEEPQYPIKYRRVSNIFPKTYSQPIDGEHEIQRENFPPSLKILILHLFKKKKIISLSYHTVCLYLCVL